MNILIIGGGGREHAIAQALLQDERVEKLWCAPGNGGIAQIAECLPYKATDLEGIVAFCKENRPDLVGARRRAADKNGRHPLLRCRRSHTGRKRHAACLGHQCPQEGCARAA